MDTHCRIFLENRLSLRLVFVDQLRNPDLNKENLSKAKEALQNLENTARKSGALPGWIENPKR
jgi:hypothetical protein